MLDNYVKWVEAHERHLLIAVAGLVLWFGIGKVDQLIINHDRANLEQAKVVAAVQQDKNDAMAKQMAQHDADTQALTAKIEARDAQLTQLQAQLVTALTKQQAVDRVATPTELTQRWNVLVPEAGAAVSATGVTVPTEGARATVVELEKSPVLAQQLTAKSEELTNTQTLLAAEGQQVLDRDGLIAGLKAKSEDDAKVCDARVKVETDKVHKTRRRWFVIGFITGFISRQAIKSYTGF